MRKEHFEIYPSRQIQKLSDEFVEIEFTNLEVERRLEADVLKELTLDPDQLIAGVLCQRVELQIDFRTFGINSTNISLYFYDY